MPSTETVTLWACCCWDIIKKCSLLIGTNVIKVSRNMRPSKLRNKRVAKISCHKVVVLVCFESSPAIFIAISFKRTKNLLDLSGQAKL